MKQIEKMLKSIDGEVKALCPSQPIVKSTDDSNYPSVRLLTYTLRNQGYSPEEAMLDMVDNSIDACDNNGTKSPRILVNCNLKATNNYLCIADNGGGFGEMSTLVEAMRLGSEIKSNESGSLGCYGVGMKLSAFSMGKRLTIVTKIGDEIITAIMDLDLAVELKSWKFTIIRKATEEEQNLLSQFVSDTIIVIDKLDKFTNRSDSEFAGRLKKSFGEVFYYKLKQNFDMYVNGDKIKPVDPMLRDLKDTTVLNYEDRENDYMVSIGGQEIMLKFYHTGSMPSGNGNTNQTTNITNQGIYVYRNDRQIMRAQTFGMFAKHNEKNQFRAELHFHSELDQMFHTPSTKTSIKIEDPALHKKISDFISIYSRQSQLLYTNKNKNENSNGDIIKKDETDIKFENAVNKSPSAPISNSDQYKEEEEKRKTQKKDPKDDVDNPEDEKKKKGRRPYQKKRVEIEYADGLSKNDPFFDYIPVGQQKWKIVYNSNHAFVKELKTLTEYGQYMMHSLVYSVILSSHEKLYNTTNLKSDQKGLLIELFLEDWSLKLRDMMTVFK